MPAAEEIPTDGNYLFEEYPLNMECKKEKNLERCNCTYEPCSRKGTCCDCIRFHLQMRELPACCFDREAERTYDRTFEHFARLVTENKL